MLNLLRRLFRRRYKPDPVQGDTVTLCDGTRRRVVGWSDDRLTAYVTTPRGGLPDRCPRELLRGINPRPGQGEENAHGS